MKIDLGGRVALVTDGRKDLGLATATEMALNGAAVAIVARDAGQPERARAQMAEQAPRARVLTVVGDVTSADQVRAAHRAVVQELGPVDVLVNNAGHHAFGPFAELSDETWDADLHSS